MGSPVNVYVLVKCTVYFTLMLDPDNAHPLLAWFITLNLSRLTRELAGHFAQWAEQLWLPSHSGPRYFRPNDPGPQQPQ